MTIDRSGLSVEESLQDSPFRLARHVIQYHVKIRRDGIALRFRQERHFLEGIQVQRRPLLTQRGISSSYHYKDHSFHSQARHVASRTHNVHALNQHPSPRSHHNVNSIPPHRTHRRRFPTPLPAAYLAHPRARLRARPNYRLSPALHFLRHDRRRRHLRDRP